jgi:uncharacterized FlgJ-related protein
MLFNLLSFTPPTDTITVNLHSEKVKDTRPEIIFRDECPKLWQQNADTLAERKYLYISFTNEKKYSKRSKAAETQC